MKKNILILDDSALMRRVLSDIINKTEDFRVAFEVANGLEGLIILEKENVDMIILDMHMPKMNGVEFLRVLKENNIHVPVVVVSGYSKRDTKDTIEALEMGALEFIRKPENILVDKDQFEHEIRRILQYADSHNQPVLQPLITPRRTSMVQKKGGRGKLVALACSTGGPKALQELIPMLPGNLDAPMVIVQHMPAGFTKSLANRLNYISDITVSEAEDNNMLEKGHVYIAKGGAHLLIESRLSDHFVKLSDAPPVNGLRPCANHTYVSLESSDFEEIICVVLTGMGSDGTIGIQRLNNSKPIYVIAQDAETSTIYGMPRAIAEAGMVDEIRPLNKIAEAIVKQVGVF